MAKRNILFKVLGVIVGVVFTVEGFSERSDIAHMKEIGKPAVVDPIRHYSKHKSIYTAEFSFTTDTGQKITRKRSFPSELVADFEARAPVTVLYDPQHPSEFIFEKEKASWLMILGGVAFAIFALLFI